MTDKRPYSQPLEMGKYERLPGACGKYDNVRRLWEDRVTGLFLAPHLGRLIRRKREEGEALRILDLGCGSGDGLDLVLAIAEPTIQMPNLKTTMVTDDMIDEYVGLDINVDLLAHAQARHAHRAKARYVAGDLSQGLPLEILLDHRPFDLYFCSYAMLSHFNDEQCAKILADICRHAPSGDALFVGDWLGHYSYEWQPLWRESPEADYFMGYRMSYLYAEPERRSGDIPVFPLRLMTPKEILAIVEEVSKQSEAELNPLVVFDRSILTGRHTDTHEYNGQIPPLRSLINSLFEPYVRTDLRELIVDYAPRSGFEEINGFYTRFFAASNRLVDYTITLLENSGETAARRGRPTFATAHSHYLEKAMQAMRGVVDGAGSIAWGDTRANLIEPTLAFGLQFLETNLQKGLGVGHSIAAIVGISKYRRKLTAEIG